MTDAERILVELQANALHEPGRAYRTFPGPEGLQIRAFVDGVSRLPGISFRVARSRVPLGMELPRIRGAEVALLPQIGAHQAEVVYELTAAHTSFAPVFIELAANLITDASMELTAEEALLRVSRRVATWARFFDARGAEGLSRFAQLGLIGELLCLERLGALVGLNAAAHAWTGPTGTPHDFQAQSGAIEAKVTTSAKPERFRISSERQLDESIVPVLLLFAVIAQESVAGAVGLPDLVAQTRARAASTAPGVSSLIEERLLQAGYSDVDRALYEVRIAVREQEFLRVMGDFPRVRPSELRSGVFAVSYDIPWLAIAPYRVLDDEVRRALSGD